MGCLCFRQERLQQLAEKFERKAGLRESWVSDMTVVLSDQNFGNNTSQVEAALKKHEAISSDIEARVSRDYTFIIACYGVCVSLRFPGDTTLSD